MPGKNRHRPPTVEQLLNRLYRKHLELQGVVVDLKEQIERLTSRTAIAAILADHCRRLLREKKTLLQVVEADQYMAAALPRRSLPVLTEDVTR